MKTKLLYVICLTFLVFTLAGCKDKSEPQPQDYATEQTSEKPSITSSEPGQSLPVSEPVSVETTPEQEESENIDYFVVYLSGNKVGYAIQKRIVSENQVISNEEMSITINLLGASRTATISISTTETIDGKPVSFECVQDLALMKTEVSGVIQPDGKLVLTDRSIGSEQKTAIEWPSDALMSEGANLLLKEKGLEEGTEYSYQLFDPTMVRVFDAKTTIGAKEQVDLLGRIVTLTETTTILSIPEMGELTSKSYYDENFTMLKNVTPTMGMETEIVACPKEFALSENDMTEFVNNILTDSPMPLNNLSSINSIKYYLEPLPDAKITIPPNDNQQIQQTDDGKLILTVAPVAAPVGAVFPYNGNEEEILEALEPSQYVQNDNKMIIELARSAVGDTKDAAEAIKKIEAFVAEYIDDKNFSVGYASAVEVALSKQGDCTEHAVLTAALCKAVGIPAQVVTGIAYVEKWNDSENVFGGHAWTQAYIKGKWIGLDAAFRGTNRDGYDAGHIALAAGDGTPGDFFSIVTSLGQFKIEKIEISKD